MKIKEGFIIRKIGDEIVVVPVATEQLNFNGMINLNETGAFLWKKLEQDCTQEELISAVEARYQISKDEAQKDVEEFIKKLNEAGFIL